MLCPMSAAFCIVDFGNSKGGVAPFASPPLVTASRCVHHSKISHIGTRTPLSKGCVRAPAGWPGMCSTRTYSHPFGSTTRIYFWPSGVVNSSTLEPGAMVGPGAVGSASKPTAGGGSGIGSNAGGGGAMPCAAAGSASMNNGMSSRRRTPGFYKFKNVSRCSAAEGTKRRFS
jgi:hypothetical protein